MSIRGWFLRSDWIEVCSRSLSVLFNWSLSSVNCFLSGVTESNRICIIIIAGSWPYNIKRPEAILKPKPDESRITSAVMFPDTLREAALDPHSKICCTESVFEHLQCHWLTVGKNSSLLWAGSKTGSFSAGVWLWPGDEDTQTYWIFPGVCDPWSPGVFISASELWSWI